MSLRLDSHTSVLSKLTATLFFPSLQHHPLPHPRPSFRALFQSHFPREYPDLLDQIGSLPSLFPALISSLKHFMLNTVCMVPGVRALVFAVTQQGCRAYPQQASLSIRWFAFTGWMRGKTNWIQLSKSMHMNCKQVIFQKSELNNTLCSKIHKLTLIQKDFDFLDSSNFLWQKQRGCFNSGVKKVKETRWLFFILWQTCCSENKRETAGLRGYFPPDRSVFGFSQLTHRNYST